MESMKGVWNGDVDLGDGKLKELRKEYDDRVHQVGSFASLESHVELETGLRHRIDHLDGDVVFLESGFKEAVEVYRKKFTNPSTAEETLKNANWNVVEFQTLLQQAQLLKQAYEPELRQLNPAVVRPQDLRVVKTSLRGMAGDAKSYLRNLFKKKRTVATHVLVLMLSGKTAKEALCLASEVHPIQKPAGPVCSRLHKRSERTYVRERTVRCG